MNFTPQILVFYRRFCGWKIINGKGRLNHNMTQANESLSFNAAD
jgi:hypothetical protein